jgi:hypothetical protein
MMVILDTHKIGVLVQPPIVPSSHYGSPWPMTWIRTLPTPTRGVEGLITEVNPRKPDAILMTRYLQARPSSAVMSTTSRMACLVI